MKTDAPAGSCSRTEPTPRSRSSRAVTSRPPAAPASSTSRGRALPTPRRPTWTTARRGPSPRRGASARSSRGSRPRTSSRKSRWASTWSTISGPSSVVRGEDRDRDGVVAAEDDRDRAPLEQGANGGLGPGRAAGAVRWVTGHVAAVHDPLGIREHRGTGVEVVVADERRQSQRTAAGWRRAQPRSRRRPRPRVADPVRNAEDRDTARHRFRDRQRAGSGRWAVMRWEPCRVQDRERRSVQSPSADRCEGAHEQSYWPWPDSGSCSGCATRPTRTTSSRSRPSCRGRGASRTRP